MSKLRLYVKTLLRFSFFMFGAPATAHFWQLISALRRRGRSQECTFARKLPRGTAPRVARELRRGAGRRPIFFYVLKTLSELRNWMEFDNLLCS